MKYIFFCTVAIHTLSSCTLPSSRGKQMAECYVRYLAPEAQLLAEVTLKQETPKTGTLQAVEAPEGVRYRDAKMEVVPAQGITYQVQQTGGYHPDHTFQWTDQFGDAHTFTLQMPAISRFGFEPKELSRQQPAELWWEGAPLSEGESLVLMWETPDRQSTVPMEIIGSPGQQRIAFPAAQLSKLAPGAWTLYLVRKKRFKEVQAGTSLLGLTEYYTLVDTLQVN